MKKILAVLMSLAVTASVSACVFAEGVRVTDTAITAENVPENGTIIAVLYDSEGALTGLKTYKGTETAKYAEDMASILPVSEMIKVDGIPGLILKALICVFIPGIMYLLIYCRTENFKKALKLIKL